jgi:hypothetical protein
MPTKAAWVMSESNAFELLNAIDERLATARLDQHQHDVLVRLRSMLEDDLDAQSGSCLLQGAEAPPVSRPKFL